MNIHNIVNKICVISDCDKHVLVTLTAVYEEININCQMETVRIKVYSFFSDVNEIFLTASSKQESACYHRVVQCQVLGVSHVTVSSQNSIPMFGSQRAGRHYHSLKSRSLKENGGNLWIWVKGSHTSWEVFEIGNCPRI